ncbi:MAG TPA: biotin/lipoyl-binding protein, partial [Gammaproteobacteria bacterium]|nr:biotin/lipoyl-binding protein [Gammaproteobacteria bacterium]
MKKVIQTLPDLGKIEEAEVIEICVTPGDSVVPEQTLIVIETEKVVVDLPAEYSGRITSVLVKLGDLIAEGDAIVEMEVDEKSTSLEQKELDSSETINQVEKLKEKSLPQTSLITPKKEKSMTSSQDYSNTHAGPSVRKMAR